MNIAFVTLVFYIAAILADGTFFTPHRPTIATTTATALIMIALSSLLYITIVPARMQFVLFGAGILHSAAFLLIVLTCAFVLPGIAIITLNFTVFLVAFVGFLLDLMLTFLIGVFHFFRGLALYHAQHTYLCLRQIYSNLSEDDYDQQLLAYSDKLLRHARSNWNLHRVPRSLLDSADHAVRTVLPEHLHDDVEFAPFTTMGSLDSNHDQEDANSEQEQPQTLPTETTALLGRTPGF
ncbi:hypothetical protein BWQ96_05306 [Gracilariopsis chorda]|uniref:Uncharacterized protein n=1 Tax=Gracilariopsis chorda TaxID=448386 RepID=A0A2V3IS53_9FLOR|nr:hypothetical protein BWQ96_05306 [Gracilariopsis chorda]|eukprot:PXF44942.1 hypothetical protein BWQ96_05306 [Gracilariopsis chorda]